MQIKIKKLHEGAVIPNYAHEGDAGMDVYSVEETLLNPGETKTISTGISLEIPKGYVALVWDKSGLASKNSIHTFAGVIDSGYRGEIGVVIKNLGNEVFEISKDMKIAQILIQPVVSANLIEVDDLDETSRNQGGFGSTGKH